MRSLLLLLTFILALPASVSAYGIGIGFPFYKVVGYGPDLSTNYSEHFLTLQVAFPIKPKLAIGVLAEGIYSEFEREGAGREVGSATQIPISFLAYYYPLEGVFNPYFLGHIGPVILQEEFIEGPSSTSSFSVGPGMGLGVGVSMRWPVTPFLEGRCAGGLPNGDRITSTALCLASVGLSISF